METCCLYYDTHLGRAQQLKGIRPDFVLPELIRRFSRESEVLGRLQHPGIAQIYEAGTFEDPYGPQPLFATELVKGQCNATAGRGW